MKILYLLTLHFVLGARRRDITINGTATPTAVEKQCIKHAPPTLDRSLRSALCIGVAPESIREPGKCAYSAMRSGSGALSPEDTVLLCQRG